MITNGPLRKKVVKVKLEILVSVGALAETRVQVVQNRTSVFIKIQIHHTDNILNSGRVSQWLICNRRIDSHLQT